MKKGLTFVKISKLVRQTFQGGEWRSLVSAPALGAGGRRFKSDLPDLTPKRGDAPVAQMDRAAAF